MRSVGIKILKNQLSKYVKYAEQGETVLVCDRDRVVAVLGAPPATMARTLPDAMLADLIRDGLLCPALTSAGQPAVVPPPGVVSFDQLMAELAADRDEQ